MYVMGLITLVFFLSFFGQYFLALIKVSTCDQRGVTLIIYFNVCYSFVSRIYSLESVPLIILLLLYNYYIIKKLRANYRKFY